MRRNAAQVIAVFVHAPDEEIPWALGAESRWWLHRSLHALATALQARGSRLIIRCGPTGDTLRTLLEEAGATLLTWNRLYEPTIIAR